MSKPATARWKIMAGLGVACAACCAPLLVPLLAGATGASIVGATGAGAFGLPLGEIVLSGWLPRCK